MTEHGQSLLGVGVYSVPEASRLTHVSASRIRRWLRGYTFETQQGTHASPPVWHKQVPSVDESLALSFKDLIEIRFVDAFRKHGVSWKVLRLAAERAAEIIQDTHPFSTRKFKTDGRKIFADIVHATGDESLLDLVKSQYEFKQVVDPFLFEGLEFSDLDGGLLRWWPLTQKRRVVLDPRRSFGQPIVAAEGVPTRILAGAFRAEQSIAAVASWYLVDPRSVQDAVDYEDQLAA